MFDSKHSKKGFDLNHLSFHFLTTQLFVINVSYQLGGLFVVLVRWNESRGIEGFVRYPEAQGMGGGRVYASILYFSRSLC